MVARLGGGGGGWRGIVGGFITGNRTQARGGCAADCGDGILEKLL